jgi:hypothetical protein
MKNKRVYFFLTSSIMILVLGYRFLFCDLIFRWDIELLYSYSKGTYEPAICMVNPLRENVYIGYIKSYLASDQFKESDYRDKMYDTNDIKIDDIKPLGIARYDTIVVLARIKRLDSYRNWKTQFTIDKRQQKVLYQYTRDSINGEIIINI